MTTGAIATSHHLATEVGADALRRGGTAVDAALAAAAMLCVVYPNNVALGGDLVAMVRDPHGRIRVVNATGRAPIDGSLEDLTARHGAAIPTRGVDAVTVPTALRGWATLHAIGGSASWAALLEPAVAAAERSPVARSVARATQVERDALAADAGCSAVLLRDGRPLVEGEPLEQPALARTLRTIAANGPEAFYSGALADAWVAGLRALGSRISHADLAAAAADTCEPISVEAFGTTYLTSPPNTQGFCLLRALRAADAQPAREPLGADAGWLAEVLAAGNAVRDTRLADPELHAYDLEALLEATAPAPEAAPPARGDTVGLVATSDDGWAVSLVQSVYWAFGACVLEPTTGVLFQNRGTAFRLDPVHPAVYAPGARPPHSLMPVMAVRDGRLRTVAATMGGQAQAQLHTQLALRLEGGASGIEALSAPRWVVGAQSEGDEADTLVLEADVDDVARASLDAGPWRMRTTPPRDEDLGHANLIVARDDGWDAASDPRSDGSARVVASASTVEGSA